VDILYIYLIPSALIVFNPAPVEDKKVSGECSVMYRFRTRDKQERIGPKIYFIITIKGLHSG